MDYKEGAYEMVWYRFGFDRCCRGSRSLVENVPFLIGGGVFVLIGLIIFIYGSLSLPK